MPAHLTILPPRELVGTEAAALEFLEEACSRVVPFSVELGDVETFLPTTPTVFIQVKRAAYRIRELHDQLCGKGLHCDESWPYIPHLTILKAETDEQAERGVSAGTGALGAVSGQARGSVEELMFVRENGTVTGRIWRRCHWAAANCPRSCSPGKTERYPSRVTALYGFAILLQSPLKTRNQRPVSRTGRTCTFHPLPSPSAGLP